jgi:hypothetical protein
VILILFSYYILILLHSTKMQRKLASYEEVFSLQITPCYTALQQLQLKWKTFRHSYSNYAEKFIQWWCDEKLNFRMKSVCEREECDWNSQDRQSEVKRKFLQNVFEFYQNKKEFILNYFKNSFNDSAICSKQIQLRHTRKFSFSLTRERAFQKSNQTRFEHKIIK